MGNSDLTLLTTTPRTSDHGRATKPRTSGTGRRLARGRCSHLLSPSSASGCCRICQRSITWGLRRRYCEECRALINADSIGVLSHSGRRLGCAPGVAIWLWRARPVVSAVGTRRGSGTSLAAAAVRSKRQLEDRKARAVCTLCEAPAATGRLRCQACLADSRGRHRRDRARWRAAGLCVGCGRTPRRGVKLCAVCLARGKKLRTKNEGQGFCRCGRFVTPGRKSCAGLSSCGEGVSAAAALEGHY